jgi:hypothetical protein
VSRHLGKPQISRMTGLTKAEASPPSPSPVPPKLLDRLQTDLRTRHDSIRTEQVYVDGVRRFVLFHNKRHPKEMAAAEVAAFLTHLAVDRQVSASTQHQAKSALNIDLPWLDEVVQAKAPRRLPVVLTPHDVREWLLHMQGITGRPLENLIRPLHA